MSNLTSTDYITKNLKLCPPIINAICTQSLKVVHQSACKQKLVPIITSNIMFSCRFCGFNSESARSCSVYVGPCAQKKKRIEDYSGRKTLILVWRIRKKRTRILPNSLVLFFKRKICANSVTITM